MHRRAVILHASVISLFREHAYNSEQGQKQKQREYIKFFDELTKDACSLKRISLSTMTTFSATDPFVDQLILTADFDDQEKYNEDSGDIKRFKKLS